jgi:hypothetical protein
MSLSPQEEEAKARYEIRREIARASSQDRFAKMGLAGEGPRALMGCDFMAITDHALAASQGWQFPWRKIMGQNRPYLRRFELALWHNGTLYGLCVGRVSRGHQIVALQITCEGLVQKGFF